MVDKSSIQSRMTDGQKLMLEILGVIYASECPVSLETIAHKVQPVSPHKLLIVVTELVSGGSVQIQICNGCVNYQKPKPKRGPFPPLPFFYFD